MGKKEQGYVGVIRDGNGEVLGYALEPKTKRQWEAVPEAIKLLEETIKIHNDRMSLMDSHTYYHPGWIGIVSTIISVLDKFEGKDK